MSGLLFTSFSASIGLLNAVHYKLEFRFCTLAVLNIAIELYLIIENINFDILLKQSGSSGRPTAWHFCKKLVVPIDLFFPMARRLPARGAAGLCYQYHEEGSWHVLAQRGVQRSRAAHRWTARRRLPVREVLHRTQAGVSTLSSLKGECRFGFFERSCSQSW